MKRFQPYIYEAWNPFDPKESMTEGFLNCDKQLLSAKSGFLGVGERGVGGAKCGATCAAAFIYSNKGVPTLVAANVGDARTLLVRKDGSVEDCSYEHVPDDEEERKVRRYDTRRDETR